MTNQFGTLTRKKQTKQDIKSILNEDTIEIEYLFGDAKSKLEKLTVIEAERKIALDNLRKLTKELQTMRLHYNEKDELKYFTL